MKPLPKPPQPPSEVPRRAENATTEVQRRRAESGRERRRMARGHTFSKTAIASWSCPQSALLMKANALRVVRKLSTTDILQLANDPHLYRMLALEETLSGRWKVMLRSLDGMADVMLVRSATDCVFVVPDGALMH